MDLSLEMLEEKFCPRSNEPRISEGLAAVKTMMTNLFEEKKEDSKEQKDLSLLSPAEEIQGLHARVHQLEKEKAEMEAENKRLKDMLVNEIPSLLSTMRHTFAARIETTSSDCFVSDEDCKTSCSDSVCSTPTFPTPPADIEGSNMQSMCASANVTNSVEVYKGSNVYSEGMVWKAAIQANSATAMARTLLLGVFDMDTLLRSNLRGGKSKRANYADQKEGLDPLKLDAIYNATLKKFPNAKRGQIGVGINSKLSEIRFRYRKAKREKGCDIFC
ncbi:uncharacterized protein LOC121316718 isoform X3 [Polyodon spathula]|nr:uncharacterized protein LOC121316718 isoform X3 [Polyodon spathula]